MNQIANIFIMQSAAAVAASNANEDDVYPSCNKPEDIVYKCRHCGHEYELDESDETNGWVTLAWMLAVIAFAVLVAMFFSWTFKIDDKGFDRTFVQYIGDQLTYFWKKII